MIQTAAYLTTAKHHDGSTGRAIITTTSTRSSHDSRRTSIAGIRIRQHGLLPRHDAIVSRHDSQHQRDEGQDHGDTRSPEGGELALVAAVPVPARQGARRRAVKRRFEFEQSRPPVVVVAHLTGHVGTLTRCPVELVLAVLSLAFAEGLVIPAAAVSVGGDEEAQRVEGLLYEGVVSLECSVVAY